MRKAADAFRSIGEVSQLVGVPPHVLRYWETQFAQLTPVKRADGRRYYRPEDLHLAAGICELLREEGMTTRGAARVIARDKGAEVRARGLARLPDRFRGTADPSTTKDTTTPITQGEAEADETMAKQPDTAGAMRTSTTRRGTTPSPSARPGTEATGAEPNQEAEIPKAAPQSASAPDGTPGDQECADSGRADEPVPSLPLSPVQDVAHDAAESPQDSTDDAPETVEAASAEAMQADEDDLEGMAIAEHPAASEPAAPAGSAAAGQAEAIQPAQGGADLVTAAPFRPAPATSDLPLFPGLAPAAPPPGIWLPRLAAAVEALREMPTPRRPTARMQHLRDRIAALIDADH